MADDSGRWERIDCKLRDLPGTTGRVLRFIVWLGKWIWRIVHGMLYASCVLIIVLTGLLIAVLVGMFFWRLLVGPPAPEALPPPAPVVIEHAAPSSVPPGPDRPTGPEPSTSAPATALPASGPVTTPAAMAPPTGHVAGMSVPEPSVTTVPAEAATTRPEPAGREGDPPASPQADVADASVDPQPDGAADASARSQPDGAADVADASGAGAVASRNRATADVGAGDDAGRAERWAGEQRARQRQQARRLELQRERERVRLEARDEAARRQLAREIARQRLKVWQHSSPLDVLEEHVDEDEDTVLYESGIGWRGEADVHIWLDVTVHPEPRWAGEEDPWLGLSIVFPEAGDFLFTSVALVADGVAYTPAELSVDGEDRPDMRRATVQILKAADIRFLRRFVRARKPVLRFSGPQGQRNIRPSAQALQDLRRVLEAWAFLYHAVLAEEAEAAADVADEEAKPERFGDRGGSGTAQMASVHPPDPERSSVARTVEKENRGASRLVETAASLYILNTLLDGDRQAPAARAQRRAARGSSPARTNAVRVPDVRGQTHRPQVGERGGAASSREAWAGSRLSPLGRAAIRARGGHEASRSGTGGRGSASSTWHRTSRDTLSGRTARSRASGLGMRSSPSRSHSSRSASRRRR